MHYQFNVKVVHTLTHLILPGHPTLPFEGFRGKYSVGQAHTYPCGQVYDFDRREGVARPESKHQIIIIIHNFMNFQHNNLPGCQEDGLGMVDLSLGVSDKRRLWALWRRA